MKEAKKSSVITTKISDLNEEFFVRVSLNQERVNFLAGLLVNETVLDPIEISMLEGKLVVVDGRHRVAANSAVGNHEVECTVLEFDSKASMISYAFLKNSGGSLQATSADALHVIRVLLSEGLRHREVVAQLSKSGSYSPRTIQKWVKDVSTENYRKSLRDAVRHISEGKTVDQASELTGLKKEQIQRGLNPSAFAPLGGGPADKLKGKVSTEFHRFNLSLGQHSNSLTREVNSGLITPEQARGIIAEWGRRVSNVQKQFANTQARLSKVLEIYENLGHTQLARVEPGPTRTKHNTDHGANHSDTTPNGGMAVKKPVKVLTPSQIKKTDEVFRKMGISPKDHKKITEEEFVLRAIREIRKGTEFPGIHTVFTGFNDAFRRYFGDGSNPVEAITKLRDDGKIFIMVSRKGSVINLAEDRKDKSNS